MRVIYNSPCKIYSRKRLNLFHFENKMNRNNKYKKEKRSLKVKITIILIITIIIIYIILKSFNSIFETLCQDKAKEIATRITNEEATKVMAKYQYEEMFNIEKDSNENIQLITANVLKINEITSEIAVNIQEELNNNTENSVNIAVGTVLGSKIFSGRGPKINLKISSVGNIKTDLKSEFEEKSISQTLHKVYLELECKVSILTPFETIGETIKSQILLAENVIVGNIPQTYYNLPGIK